jgi:hypothetical protein
MPLPDDDPCSAVLAAASELLLPDDGNPRLAPLRAHLLTCDGCRDALAFHAALIEELRRLPVAADAKRSWASLRLALRDERRAAAIEAARPRTIAPSELVALAAVAIGVAAALVRMSPHAARALAAPASANLWLLPSLFVAFGAAVALLALPLLRATVSPQLTESRAS